MFELSGFLCISLVALAIITLVGHGVWVFIAFVWRAIFAHAPGKYSRPNETDDQLYDLAAIQRQLRRLVESGRLDPATFDRLSAVLTERRRELLVGEPRPAVEPTPIPEAEKPQAPLPVASTELIVEALPVSEPVPAPPEVPAARPITLPRPPRRAVGEVLAAFMEEHNILWGELVGGLLIVGCSIALVIYLLQTQKEIPYFPFFVVAGVTAALFGAGLYSLRRWKLETTGRGLLIIATLLVPLSFLVLADLSRGGQGGWVEIVIRVAAIGAFAWLVSLAGAVLAAPETMPGRLNARWLLTIAVLAASAVELLVPRLVDPAQPALWAVAALGLVTTVCHGLTTGAVLLRARGGLRDAEAHTLLGFLGMATFPVAVALGFLVYLCDDPALALERVALFIAAAGVPVLATGVLVHSSPILSSGEPAVLAAGWSDPAANTAGSPDTGPRCLSAPIRTIGTGVALAGMLILLAAVAIAWPRPVALVLVCVLDFAVLSAVAWRCHLPIAHAAALPCLAIGYLTAYHLLTGGLDVARAELGGRLLDLALTPASGAALTVLAVLLAAGAEVLVRLNRRLDGIYHAVGAGVVAVASLALVAGDGFDNPARAAIVWGTVALAGLLANARWRRTWVTYAAAVVSLGAIAYTLHGFTPEMTAARLWLSALLLHATIFLAASIALGWIYRPGAPVPADQSLALRAGLLTGAFVVPLRSGALVSSVLALLPLLAASERDVMALEAGYAAWLAFLWLAFAWVMGSSGLFTAFQVLLCATVLLGVTAWLDGQGWIQKWPTDLTSFRSLQTYGICLAALGLLWVVARLALRADERAQRLLEPSHPAFDRIMIGWTVLAFLGMTVVGIAPAIVAEWTPVGDAYAGFTTEATGPGAWALFATLVVVLTAALWDRLPTEALLGLLLLILSVPLLVAGAFAADRAAASALRWGLAVAFAVCSAAFWLRDRLTLSAGRLGIRVEGNLRLPTTLRLVLLGGAAAPVVVLTAVAAGLQISGETLGGPTADSLFVKIGSLTSNLVPLAVVSIGLVGHGIRERSAGYAFAAGLLANVTLTGGYMLAAITSGGEMDDAEWAFVLQLGTFAAAAWTGLCLASRPWIGVWREDENPAAKPLMRVQLGMSIVGNTALFISLLFPLFLRPELTLSPWLVQVGHAAGWLALLLSAGVVFWYTGIVAPMLRVHVVGGFALGVATVAASAFNPSGLPWVSYHALLATGGLVGLAFLVAGIAAACFRLSRPQSALFPFPGSEESIRSSLPPGEREEASVWLGWFAELFPAEAVHSWLSGIGLALVLFALRGGWTDPQRPYWSVGGVMTASAITAALAVWFRHQRYVYASGLLVNLAGILLWVAHGPDTIGGFLAVNALGLAVASCVWSAIELALRFARGARGVSEGRDQSLARASRSAVSHGQAWPFAHTAVIVALALLGVVIGTQTALGWNVTIPRSETVLTWLAVAATVAAYGVLLWDMRARFVAAGLYIVGIWILALILVDIGLSPGRFWWTAAWSLAAYVLLTSALRAMAPLLLEVGRRLGVPERRGGWPVDWFIAVQAGTASCVVVLSLWIVLGFPLLSDRIAGPLAAALLVPAGVLLAGTPDRWRAVVRYVALALGVVVAAELGWALLDPAGTAPWLHRNALLLVALAVMTAGYGVILPRSLRSYPEWTQVGRRIGPRLGLLAAVQLLVVLGHEAALYNPDPTVRTTPLAWWGVLAVAGGFGLLIVAMLRFAVTPGREPLGFSERGRTLYVYASEVLLVLLLAHLRLNVPDLFPPFVGRYWPFVVMGIAFLGVGLGEWFARRGWRVLAEPIGRTGVFLPLLPLVAFWVRDLTGVRETLVQNVPALSPLLRYLERMEGGFGLHAGIWFIVGMLYALVAVNRRSFRFALLAALAANFGLWVIFANVEGLHFIAHPQLWLIPLAIIMLVAEHLNRDKLSDVQATALRYLALTVLYVSSTADMFLAGIGNSILLPVVLAVLCVLGILAGIVLRVRAFLFQGVTFLFVVVFTMIWLAAVKRGHVWVWYLSGIALGAAILALFALFEKRRKDVERMVEELKKWE